MNFKKLLETQREYEERVGYIDKDRFKKKILALMVEVGESANERPSFFKFWSKSHIGSAQKNAEFYARAYQLPPIDVEEDLFLEELVDMFSFILALGVDIGIDVTDITPGIMMDNFDDKVDLYLLFSESVLNLYTIWRHENMTLANKPVYLLDRDAKKPAFNEMMARFFALIIAFNYNLNEIETAYYKKNSVNLSRHSNGY